MRTCPPGGRRRCSAAAGRRNMIFSDERGRDQLDYRRGQCCRDSGPHASSFDPRRAVGPVTVPVFRPRRTAVRPCRTRAESLPALDARGSRPPRDSHLRKSRSPISPTRARSFSLGIQRPSPFSTRRPRHIGHARIALRALGRWMRASADRTAVKRRRCPCIRDSPMMIRGKELIRALARTFGTSRRRDIFRGSPTQMWRPGWPRSGEEADPALRDRVLREARRPRGHLGSRRRDRPACLSSAGTCIPDRIAARRSATRFTPGTGATCLQESRPGRDFSIAEVDGVGREVRYLAQPSARAISRSTDRAAMGDEAHWDWREAVVAHRAPSRRSCR
jgi:hypothetical protein